MSGFTFNTWTLLGSANATVTAAGSTVFGIIDNAGKVSTEVSVEGQYNVSATTGATIQIERDIDGTNFEPEDSNPWPTPLPFAAGAVKKRGITVMADQIGKFRVRVVNNDGNDLTNVNVRFKQSTYA